MRIFIAGLLGGIVLFVWGMVAHVVLPTGHMGMRVASNQDAAIAALHASADKGAGVYLIPGMAPEMYADRPALAAFQDKYKDAPSAFLVYDPSPNPTLQSMTAPLVKQFISNVLMGVLAAWILALATVSFGTRVMMGTAIGVISWLAISVPYWTWYRFPMDFTIATWLDVGVGMIIASVVMAWWLGRRR
jgi:hypothetical protein